MIDRMVTGQATTIAYQNDFLLMTLMGVLCLPLVLAFRGPKRPGAKAARDGRCRALTGCREPAAFG